MNAKDIRGRAGRLASGEPEPTVRNSEDLRLQATHTASSKGFFGTCISGSMRVRGIQTNQTCGPLQLLNVQACPRLSKVNQRWSPPFTNLSRSSTSCVRTSRNV